MFHQINVSMAGCTSHRSMNVSLKMKIIMIFGIQNFESLYSYTTSGSTSSSAIYHESGVSASIKPCMISGSSSGLSSGISMITAEKDMDMIIHKI